MLLEDRGEVALGDVALKGAVAEDDAAFLGVGRGELVTPLHDPQGQWLGIGRLDLRREAGEEHAAADAFHLFARDLLRLDRDAEIEAGLEEDVVDEIVVGAVGLNVVDRFGDRRGDILRGRIPRLDIAGVELEDAEAEVTLKQCRSFGYSLGCLA